MSISLRYPFKRVSYPGIDNPEFIGDVRVLTEGIMSSLAMMANLPAAAFAIVSGLRYIPQSVTVPQAYYTPGFFYLNGIFYEVQTTVIPGSWLSPNVTTALQVGFNDGITRPIYQYFGADVVQINPANGCPQFNGTMDNYRIGLDWLADSVRSLLVTQGNLGSAAFKNVGSIAGTVMAGDDPRAPYTAGQLDARYAQQAQVILKGTLDGSYVPTEPGDPVPLNYFNAHSGLLLAKGRTPLGDADTGPGTLHTIPIGQTLASANYLPMISIISKSVNPNLDIFHQVTVRNLTPVSFDCFFREAQAGVQDIDLAWMLWSAT